MAGDTGKFTESFSNRVAPGTFEAFKRTVPRGFKIAHCLDAAMRVWVDLPSETRLQILTGQITEPLVDIVTQIVDDRIAEGRDAGKRLTEPLRKKRDRTD